MSSLRVIRGRRPATFTAVLVGGALILAACSDDAPDDRGGTAGGGSLEGVTITLAGPNQWNDSAETFGAGWDEFVAAFEEETGIVVETNVLPISEFSQTISTQLAAGTAPELVFNQPPHEPETVVPLDDYLSEPNPFAEGNDAWYDLFLTDYYGYDAGSVNGQGNLEWVPFNLIGLGVFYNEEIFAEVGIEAPLETYGDYLEACDTLRDAGYDPYAMDASLQGHGQVVNFIYNQLASTYFDDLNVYTGSGEEGQAETQLALKSTARAIATGELTTQTPEVAESLRLTKEFLDRCATPNWSGIPPAPGGFVNTADFVSGTAAMALGSNLSAADEQIDFEFGTMPFGTVSEEDSELSTGFAAQAGLGAGGTAYMISGTTEGPELEAAVAFLQYASSPTGVQTFLDGMGGIPAIEGAEPAPGLEGILESEEWGQPLLMGPLPPGPQATVGQPIIDGYLIGEDSLEEEQAALQDLWNQAVAEQIADNEWSEDWATGFSAR